MYMGKSLYINLMFGSAKFDELDDGWVYWVVVGCKLVGGVRLILGV